jgi:hypothetical protein
MSIFRTRKDPSSGDQSSTESVSRVGGHDCGSGSGSGSGSTKTSQQFALTNSTVRREKYEENLRQQYFEHGDRLSRDVQANISLTLTGARTFDDNDVTFKRSGSNLSDGKQQSTRKNRCKKCGQVKMGHVCPYASSLLRNIGRHGISLGECARCRRAGDAGPGVVRDEQLHFDQGWFICMIADDRKMPMSSSIAIGDRNEFRRHNLVSGISLFRRKTLLGPPTTACNPIDDKRSDAGAMRDAAAENKTTDWLFQPSMDITTDQYRLVTPRDASPRPRGTMRTPKCP